MLITALAVAITAGFVTAVPLVLWRAQARAWAWVWSVTAYFAVQEMWMAEYRQRLVIAWETAYWRDTEILQRQLQQSARQRQSILTPAGDDDSFLRGLVAAARGPHARCSGDYKLSDERSRNGRNIPEVASILAFPASWQSFRCTAARISLQKSLPDNANGGLEKPYRIGGNTRLLVLGQLRYGGYKVKSPAGRSRKGKDSAFVFLKKLLATPFAQTINRRAVHKIRLEMLRRQLRSLAKQARGKKAH